MRLKIKPTAWKFYVPILTLLFFLFRYSGSSLLNTIVPRSGYQIYSDIAYGSHSRQRLDIYVPNVITNPGSVVLFFYGGSWQYGNKEQYRFVGQAFASEGVVAVIADYRLYPEIYFPEFLDDSAKALTWVHNHVQAYGGNPKNIFLAGHSAGAFNAVMLTVNPDYLKRNGATLSWIRGTIGIAGPYDFLPFTDHTIKKIFSKVNDANTQPIHFVSSGLPPILLLTGTKDTEVYPKNATHLYQKLLQYRNPAELIMYPHIGHIEIIVSLAYGFRWRTTLLNDVMHFVKQNTLTH